VDGTRSAAKPLGGGPAHALATFGPALLFTVLYAATYARWVLPFQDGGREVGVAIRFFSGETLYRDIAYWFGPVPPALDALAFRLFGPRLGVLFGLRACVALLALEALRRVTGRLVPSPAFAAATTCLVVGVCAFDPGGGAWPFPYTAAALEGLGFSLVALEAALGSGGPRRSLLAAAVAALACGTKLEVVPMALGGLAVALFCRRPRREALVATGLAAAAGSLFWLVPLARFGPDLLGRRGFLMALRVSEPLKEFYRRIALGGFTPEQFLSPAGLSRMVPSVLLLAAVAAFARRQRGRAAEFVLFGLGIGASLLPANLALHAFAPFAAVALAVEGARALLRRDSSKSGPSDAALLAVGAAMIPFLLRQPLFLMRYCPYTAYSGPLALTFGLAALARWTGGTRSLGALALGLALGFGGRAVHDFHDTPREWVRAPRGSLLLPSAEARLVNGLLERIARDTRPGDFVAGFPEPGLVLFLAERRSPFAFEQFNPGDQGLMEERRMIEALGRRPPAAAFIVNRTFLEYGRTFFGRGYLDEFMSVFRERMTHVETLERLPGNRPRAVRADAAVWFRPRPSP